MADFNRPSIPYVPPEILPYSNRYQEVARRGNSPTGQQFDGDINYLIASLNELQETINGIAAGILPGSDNPLNILHVPATDGNGNIFWTKVTAQYIDDGDIPGSKLEDESITTEKYGLGSVGRINIAPESIDDNLVEGHSLHFGVMIIENNVDFQNFFNAQNANTLDGTTIQNNSLPATAIPDESIPAEKLEPISITAAQLNPIVAPIIGSFIPWGGPSTVAPPGCLFPNGQNVSRATYASLFLVYGTTYGAGDGATTFGLPDLRGRSLFHLDMTAANTPAATNNRITTATANALTVGGVGGVQQVNLDETQIPPHIHPLPMRSSGLMSGLSGPNPFSAASPPYDLSSQSTGGGQPHNNMTPFMFCQYLIYAGV